MPTLQETNTRLTNAENHLVFQQEKFAKLFAKIEGRNDDTGDEDKQTMVELTKEHEAILSTDNSVQIIKDQEDWDTDFRADKFMYGEINKQKLIDGRSNNRLLK